MKRLGQMTLACLGILTITTLSLTAQDGKENALRQEGAKHMQSGEWSSAVEAFSALTELQPTDKIAWFQLGYSQHAMGAHDEAITSYESMLAVQGFHPLNITTMYNMACAYALKGEKETAFEWLEKSVNAGFNQTKQITSDTDLISLRTSSRFGELVTRVNRNAHPCAYVEGARDLDFWIGSWECYNPAGQMAGTNVVRPVLDQCVIEENWTGSLGMSGRSFNYFDAATNQWRQSWVDDKGGSALFTGELVEGSMVFSRTSTDSAGTVTYHQMVLTPQEDGTVKQEGRTSPDGENWTTGWTLTYRPAAGSQGGATHDQG